MDKRLATALYVIMIVVVISFCIFLYFYLTTSGKNCVENPIEYFEKIKDARCFCTPNNILWK